MAAGASSGWRWLLGPEGAASAGLAAAGPDETPPRTTTLEWLGFGACLAAFLGLAGWYFATVGTSIVDDAFIPLRYADRLVHGEGLTFTAGSPVEGYTSLLWTLLLAAGHLLPLEPLQFARVAGIVFSVGTLVAVWRAARLVVPGPVSLVAVALVALNRSMALWSVEAMDTSLFTCCLAFALWAWLRHGTRLVHGLPLGGLAFGLLMLARPEGLLFAVPAGLLGGLAAWRAGRLRAFAVHAACAAALLGGQLAFRLLEYGELLPNTFHAKVQGAQLGRGLEYLLLWARENVVVLPAAFAVAGALRLYQTSARRPELLWLGVSLVGCLAYVALVGGDYFEFRLLVPTLPPAAILAAAGVEAVRRRVPRPGPRAAATALLAAALLGGSVRAVAVPHENDPWTIRPDEPGELAEFGWFERTARWLACNIDPRETLAVRPAGVIPYLTGAGALDMLGLTDREIAREGRRFAGAPLGHQRLASAEYVRERGATYLVGHPVRSARPIDDPTLVSAEVAPGEWLILLPLRAGATLRPGTYPLGPSSTVLEGWRPRTSGGRCVPYAR
ncbi:MAG: glycosyltransferase family 39 protein [Deltaproteobacteria bacterium]|nr:glycosyltransferase family 39 protein [Deltaproteobacteria bacterium]